MQLIDVNHRFIGGGVPFYWKPRLLGGTQVLLSQFLRNSDILCEDDVHFDRRHGRLSAELDCRILIFPDSVDSGMWKGLRDPESVSDNVSLHTPHFLHGLRMMPLLSSCLQCKRPLSGFLQHWEPTVYKRFLMFIIFNQQDTTTSFSHLLGIYLSWVCETNTLEAGLGALQPASAHNSFRWIRQEFANVCGLSFYMWTGSFRAKGVLHNIHPVSLAASTWIIYA